MLNQPLWTVQLRALVRIFTNRQSRSSTVVLARHLAKGGKGRMSEYRLAEPDSKYVLAYTSSPMACVGFLRMEECDLANLVAILFLCLLEYILRT